MYGFDTEVVRQRTFILKAYENFPDCRLSMPAPADKNKGTLVTNGNI